MYGLKGNIPNLGQIALGATGAPVRRLQRALRRTPNLGFTVDGIFGVQVGAALKNFQQGAGLAVSGTVDAVTWNALPDGGPMQSLSRDRRVRLFARCKLF